MKRLLIVTAVCEVGAGVALLGRPSALAMLLVGAPLAAPAAVSVARVGGAGLLALGVACWLARDDAESRAAAGLVTAMLLYNLGVAVILAAAGMQPDPMGVLLWPTVILHTAMSAWCIARLLGTPRTR